jgi:hypothetical protein
MATLRQIAEMFRTLDALTKIRREEEKRERNGSRDASSPASVGPELASGRCEPPAQADDDTADVEARGLTPPALQEASARQEVAAPNEDDPGNRKARRRCEALARRAAQRRSNR